MKQIYLFYLIILLGFSCQKEDMNKPDISAVNILNTWEIDPDFIVGELNNNFPLVNKPSFIKVKEERTLNENDLVFVVNYNDIIKVFPLVHIHNIEIVNDIINDLHYSVSLCPKTMSALSWNRITGNDTTEFRASGMLYKNNLLPLDTKTGDIWSQMLSVCVKGKNAGSIPENVTLVETNWKTITRFYPEAEVFQSDECNYYCDTLPGINSEKSEPVNIDEDNAGDDSNINNFDIPNGKRIFGIPLLNKLKIFTNDIFNDSTHVYIEQSLIIVGNSSIDYVQAFYRKSGLVFSAVQNRLPVIMEDNEGNQWDIFGYAVEGPLKGERLNSPTSFKAYWWAWKDFYSTIELYTNEK